MNTAPPQWAQDAAKKIIDKIVGNANKFSEARVLPQFRSVPLEGFKVPMLAIATDIAKFAPVNGVVPESVPPPVLDWGDESIPAPANADNDTVILDVVPAVEPVTAEYDTTKVLLDVMDLLTTGSYRTSGVARELNIPESIIIKAIQTEGSGLEIKKSGWVSVV